FAPFTLILSSHGTLLKDSHDRRALSVDSMYPPVSPASSIAETTSVRKSRRASLVIWTRSSGPTFRASQTFPRRRRYTSAVISEPRARFRYHRPIVGFSRSCAYLAPRPLAARTRTINPEKGGEIDIGFEPEVKWVRPDLNRSRQHPKLV